MNRSNKNTNGIPCIKATCECGNQWLIAMAPWETSWDNWINEYSKCKKCNKLPKSYIWAGLQSFSN